MKLATVHVDAGGYAEEDWRWTVDKDGEGWEELVAYLDWLNDKEIIDHWESWIPDESFTSPNAMLEALKANRERWPHVINNYADFIDEEDKGE